MPFWCDYAKRMNIEENSTKSDAYCYHALLFRIPTNDTDLFHEVHCAYRVTGDFSSNSDNVTRGRFKNSFEIVSCE